MGLEDRKQSKTLDGVVYEVTPLPFGVGKTALMRLLKIASPVLSGVFKENTTQGMASALFGSLPEHLSDEDVSYFAGLFGPYSQYQDESGNWIKLVTGAQDMHFSGRYMAFLQWLIFACEVNFADFFRGITAAGGGAGLLQKMAAKTAA